MAKTSLASIEPFDQTALLWKDIGVAPRDPFLHYVLVRIHMPPEKTAGGIIRPDQTRDQAKYNAVAAQVLAIGPTAFERDDMANSPKPRLGDWLIVAANDGVPFIYRGIPCRIITDDRVLLPIDTPEDVDPITVNAKI